MKKGLPISFIVLLILTVVLSGCGGGSGHGGGTNNGGDNGGTTYNPGQSSTFTVGGVSFAMHYAPSAANFPAGTTNQYTRSVDTAFWMAETEVTYELWYAVHDWALKHGYAFANPGNEGDDGVPGEEPTEARQEPVTRISWRDAIVWCNALTEYYNAQNGTSLVCVYTYNNAVIRDATDATACDNAVPAPTSKGFRLPTRAEWDLAAEYQDGVHWTPGNHVSGDTTGYCATPTISGSEDVRSTVFADYCWYSENSSVDFEGAYRTHPVGNKLENALHIHDMSGNVWEFCYDLYINPFDNRETTQRVSRGGAYDYMVTNLRLGYINPCNPDSVNSDLGLRIAKTH